MNTMTPLPTQQHYAPPAQQPGMAYRRRMRRIAASTYQQHYQQLSRSPIPALESPPQEQPAQPYYGPPQGQPDQNVYEK